MKQFFKEIFEYNHHCNQKLAELFLEYSGQTSEKSIQLFNHILNAHQVWNNRISPSEPVFGIWQIHELDELSEIDHFNFQKTTQILVDFDLEEMIHSNFSSGKAFQSKVKDILFHAANHGTYHRGQIASEFRNSGLEPLITDYIFYKL